MRLGVGLDKLVKSPDTGVGWGSLPLKDIKVLPIIVGSNPAAHT